MSTTELAALGLKAIEFKQAMDARKLAVGDLRDEFSRWKDEHGIGRVERHSDEWQAMLDAAHDQLEVARRAKAVERNAMNRLLRACQRVAAK